MKKILTFILAIILCTSLSGCGSHEHTMAKEVLVQASCTEDGVIKHYCTECDYSYEEPVSSTGHDFDKGTIIKEVACNADGVREYKCSVCGEKKEESISARHNFENEVVKKEASCNTAGEKIRICSVCGYKETVEVEALGHDFKDKVCARCHAYKATDLTPDYWYTYNDLDIVHVQNCLVNTAAPTTKGAIVMYNPVCKNCHILDPWPYTNAPEVDYPITKTYICKDCGTTTLIRLEIG